MKCEACGKEFPEWTRSDGLVKARICVLCSIVLGKGMPYKYLGANESDYSNGLRKLFQVNTSLFIHGGVGTGKTWLMSALMRKSIIAAAHHYDGRVAYMDKTLFVSFPEIAMKIRASMNAKTSETEDTIVNKYGKIKNLFLDDIGAEKSSEYMQSILFMLIEMRNTGRDQRTVITSNLNLNMLAQQHGERVASRIAEMCDVVKLSGSDRRLR